MEIPFHEVFLHTKEKSRRWRDIIRCSTV